MDRDDGMPDPDEVLLGVPAPPAPPDEDGLGRRYREKMTEDRPLSEADQDAVADLLKADRKERRP